MHPTDLLRMTINFRFRRAAPLRLTDSALLAAMRPAAAIEVADPNVLHAPGMVIRPLAPGDREEFMRVVEVSRADLDRTIALHRPGETNMQLFERMLQMAARGLELRRAWRAACFSDEAVPRLLGCININDISRGLECSGEVNFWMASDATGRGHATGALRAVLAHAFADLPRGLGLQRVTALIAPDNAASRRVALKAGMCPRPAEFEGMAGRRRLHAVHPLNLAGRSVIHEVFEAFAPLTARSRSAARRTDSYPQYRAGLAFILRTEAAVGPQTDG